MELGSRSAVSVTLAVTTGYVDAVGFVRLFGVFPANQSGNLVFLGMAIGGHGPAPAWRAATAIVAFAVRRRGRLPRSAGASAGVAARPGAARGRAPARSWPSW